MSSTQTMSDETALGRKRPRRAATPNNMSDVALHKLCCTAQQRKRAGGRRAGGVPMVVGQSPPDIALATALSLCPAYRPGAADPQQGKTRQKAGLEGGGPRGGRKGPRSAQRPSLPLVPHPHELFSARATARRRAANRQLAKENPCPAPTDRQG
jgi:hypothetical protein